MTDTDPRIAELQARVERLEGALERIAGFPDIRGKRSQDARDMASIARAALGRGK
jgi:hypothetical protein